MKVLYSDKTSNGNIVYLETSQLESFIYTYVDIYSCGFGMIYVYIQCRETALPSLFLIHIMNLYRQKACLLDPR